MNGPVDVRFRGEMYDRVDSLLPQQPLDEPRVADVSLHESQLRALLDVLEIGEIAGVSQRIEHDEALARVGLQPVVHEVGADEAGAAGDEESRHG